MKIYKVLVVMFFNLKIVRLNRLSFYLLINKCVFEKETELLFIYINLCCVYKFIKKQKKQT